MTVYKIRNSKGLFSTGGTSPDFNKTGKTWSSLGHVKNHLKQFYHSWPRSSWRLPEKYKDAEVCCYELTPTLTTTVSVHSMKAELTD